MPVRSTKEFFGRIGLLLIVVAGIILVSHYRQHRQDVIKAKVMAALRSKLPEFSVPMRGWDDIIASQINSRMQTGDTVPRNWLCSGVPSDPLTETDKELRWALKHSILLEQTVGPYRDEKLGTRTQKCVVAGHFEGEPNMAIRKDDRGNPYLSVNVARIGDVSIDVLRATMYRDERGGADRGTVSGYDVDFSGHVVPLYADIQISPVYFTGRIQFVEAIQHNGEMEILGNPELPSFYITIVL